MTSTMVKQLRFQHEHGLDDASSQDLISYGQAATRIERLERTVATMEAQLSDEQFLARELVKLKGQAFLDAMQ